MPFYDTLIDLYCKCYSQSIVVFQVSNAEKIKIKVGDTEIEQESTTKLLGMNIQDNLGWKEHFVS